MKMVIPIATILLLGLSLSDTWSGSLRTEVDKGEQGPGQPNSIAELFEEPSEYVEQVVRFVGLFHGFRVTGCRFPAVASAAGLTRSDWLFRIGEDCVYVTGGAPAGVDPIDPRYTGRRVEIRARVVKSPAGKILLKLIEGRLVGE